jgi:acyl-CoA synthetase (NDP forming)
MQLNEFKSKKLLSQYGIPIPKGEIATHINQVYNITKRIVSDKLVFKILSDDIVHKSDAGGVKINISNHKFGAVNVEYDNMMENITSKFPNAKIDGIYIQEMCESGIECIIGIKEDAQFGKVVMFGLGGIYAEIFKDISMRVLPITKEDALEMIMETKVFKILNGVRGKHYDINAITDSIIKVSLLSDSENVKELDINPLVVYEKGIVALDARIMI